MNLNDVNAKLFEQLDRLSNTKLTAENLETEIKRADAVKDVAQTIINNSALVFKSMQFLDERNYNGSVQNTANKLLGLDYEFDEESLGRKGRR